MSSYLKHADRPHSSLSPRAYTDASQRLRTYGPLQSMDYPRRSFWQYLTGKH